MAESILQQKLQAILADLPNLPTNRQTGTAIRRLIELLLDMERQRIAALVEGGAKAVVEMK